MCYICVHPNLQFHFNLHFKIFFKGLRKHHTSGVSYTLNKIIHNVTEWQSLITRLTIQRDHFRGRVCQLRLSRDTYAHWPLFVVTFSAANLVTSHYLLWKIFLNSLKNNIWIIRPHCMDFQKSPLPNFSKETVILNRITYSEHIQKKHYLRIMLLNTRIVYVWCLFVDKVKLFIYLFVKQKYNIPMRKCFLETDKLASSEDRLTGWRISPRSDGEDRRAGRQKDRQGR